MIPVETRGVTKSFVEPEGWDPEQDGWCGKLSVREEKIGRRMHHTSTWRPSPEEIRRLTAGGKVELTCVGVQPPVCVEVVP